MKKLSLVLAIVLLAGCAGMSGMSDMSGTSSMSGTSGSGGVQNPSMDLRSRDHAFDPYFGG